MKFSPSTKGFYLEEIHGAAIPSDAVDITEAEHAALLDGQQVGKVITAGADGNPFLAEPAPPTQEEVIQQYEVALDAHLDSVAKANRYRDRFTFAARATRPGPWYEEGCVFYDWMEACNAQALGRMNRVIAGAEPMPTIEELIADLPVFVKP